MNRVNGQVRLAYMIRQAKKSVSAKIGNRNADKLGIYYADYRVFVVTDGNTAYELKGYNLFPIPKEDYDKYIRVKNYLSKSYQFRCLTNKEIEVLTKLFREIAE
jgi:hypothetical protein